MAANVSGFVLLLIGLPAAIAPYRLARFGERIDGIGSARRWSEIEPAGWKVTLTRMLGISMAVVGAALVAGV